MKPRYPIYIPSKSRADVCSTAKFLQDDDVQFHLVVEPQEYDQYASRFGADRLLVLPDNDVGLMNARNWIKDHATAAGFERHWQLDDNIRRMRSWWRGRRLPCAAGVALSVVEDFADRYENVAIAGPNYSFFARRGAYAPTMPFWLNAHVYSCTLFLNSLPYRWRAVYNDDTDMCLQVLAGGWCTILVNAVMADKLRTMTVKGGNTDALYQGDGRLRMARSLERLWPGVVTTDRRWQRPQHVVKDSWRKFDTPLKLKPEFEGVQFDASKYTMQLVQKAPVKSERLRRMLAEQ